MVSCQRLREEVTRYTTLLVLQIAGASLLCGCNHARPSINPHKSQEIYDRAHRAFQQAALVKPGEIPGATNIVLTLSPLLLQEVPSANSNAGSRVVFFAQGETVINGRPHKQMTYLWQIPGTAKHSQSGKSWQGVRTTLDSRDRPAIWELLNDSSGARIFFLTQSVETGSRKHFGPPTEGRRFAAEAPLTGSADTIVARVIEDGPVAMGPIIHLPATNRDVVTLICRCMPPQTLQITATDYYELRPLRKNLSPALSVSSRTPPLDECLRLSPDF